MTQFRIKTTIHLFDRVKEFCETDQIGKGDLIITRNETYEKYFKGHIGQATVIDFRKYGSGEPSDKMVEAILSDIKEVSFQRVIAIGGGSVLDVAKLLVLKSASPVEELFEHKRKTVKEKVLIAVPTTCGTGSEVTNISVLKMLNRKTKLGLSADELFADYAVLIPELLETLPSQSFATSSIDAFVHAVESYLSPKANEFTQMYSIKAMEIILKGYRKLAVEGEQAKKSILKEFLLAAAYAGIAFGNAGTAAVHALSYPLSSELHISHGEANYTILWGVLQKYRSLQRDGKIKQLNQFLADIIGCREETLYQELDILFQKILPRKLLSDYGAELHQLEEFTASVLHNQGRLMANNYTELGRDDVYDIYCSLY